MCVTHQMSCKALDLDWNWYWVSISWYCLVQGQKKTFMPIYIENVEIWLGVTDVFTDRQQYLGLLSLSKV